MIWEELLRRTVQLPQRLPLFASNLLAMMIRNMRQRPVRILPLVDLALIETDVVTPKETAHPCYRNGTQVRRLTLRNSTFPNLLHDT